MTEEKGWYAENNYISYGLVTYNTQTNKGAKIYETGYDFTLRETDEETHHYYELTSGVYRPMFINGTPTILEQVDTVVSVGLVSRFDENGNLPAKDKIEKMGIPVRPNAKINVGLGRPLIP